MVINDKEAAEDLQRYMRQRGHNVNVDAALTDDGTTLNVNVHMIGPLWWYVTRWLITLPTRPLTLLRTRMEDVVVWHVARGHRVEHNVTVGEECGPLHMWDHYCHTCEVAW